MYLQQGVVRKRESVCVHYPYWPRWLIPASNHNGRLIKLWPVQVSLSTIKRVFVAKCTSQLFNSHCCLQSQGSFPLSPASNRLTSPGSNSTRCEWAAQLVCHCDTALTHTKFHFTYLNHIPQEREPSSSLFQSAFWSIKAYCVIMQGQKLLKECILFYFFTSMWLCKYFLLRSCFSVVVLLMFNIWFHHYHSEGCSWGCNKLLFS